MMLNKNRKYFKTSIENNRLWQLLKTNVFVILNTHEKCYSKLLLLFITPHFTISHKSKFIKLYYFLKTNFFIRQEWREEKKNKARKEKRLKPTADCHNLFSWTEGENVKYKVQLAIFFFCFLPLFFSYANANKFWFLN